MSRGKLRRTPLAARLGRLKHVTLGVIASREKLPQPLFWSLFHVRIAEIRAEKDRDREVRRIVLGIGS